MSDEADRGGAGMRGHGKFRVEWQDSGREPTQPPNPAYPNGICLDVSVGRGESCTVELPYPARRCGRYLIDCRTCGYRIILTTAGRVDDPRSVTLPCRAQVNG